MSNEEVVARMKAQVGRFDGELHTISFSEGEVVRTLLERANVDFGDGQTINDEEGNDVEPTAVAEDGKEYYIVGNYKQGSQ